MWTSQNHGYSPLGRPCATGRGISTGSSGASLGSQSSSFPPGCVGPFAARQPHGELVPEPEDRVDGPAGLDPAERKVGPVGELLGEEPPNERLVEVELVGVHPRHGCYAGGSSTAG